MLYFLLGQLVAYAACWAITVLITPAYQLAILVVVALFCELIACPVLDSNATIKAALQSGRMSRWCPFTIGLIGATGWISATVITSWGLDRWLRFAGVPLAFFLIGVWILVGVLGAVTLTEKIAASRLQQLH